MNMLGAGVAFAAGAAIMYSFDPDHGRRRRARLRNEADHLVHAVPRSLRQAGADSTQRVRGKLTHLRHLPSAEATPDEVLGGRVRAALGRCCSHASAVTVTPRSGVVELRGPILAAEAQDTLRHVRRIPGVESVNDLLERHDTVEGVSSLQGHRGHPRPRFWIRKWPISLRWATGAAGAGLAASGLVQGGIPAVPLVLAGTAAFLRAASNRPVAALLGVGDGPQNGIDVMKTIAIEAPADEVFAYFLAFENFPKFMRHVRGVRRVDEDRWHWTVQGGGMTFEWDGIITRCEPPSRVAWTSTEAAAIKNHGEATFEAISDRATRLTIHLVYSPPLGAVGHAIAKFLGADPKSELNDDLLRFKSLLETGKATGRDGSVTRADVPLTPLTV
jgi:uncharacterized membrane protein